MTIKRHATATWEGTVARGGGRLGLGSGAFDGPFTAKARVEDTDGTNPEELIGAASAGCFTMSMANLLTKQRAPAEHLSTEATVYLEQQDGRHTITRIELALTGSADVDSETFERLAHEAKETCTVSRALAGTEILLSVKMGPR